MSIVLTLYKNVLRKLTPAEVDANFENLSGPVNTLVSEHVSSGAAAVRIRAGATGDQHTITLRFTPAGGPPSFIVNLQMVGCSAYLDYSFSCYVVGAGSVNVTRNVSSAGTTVSTSVLDSGECVVTITTAVTHPVVNAEVIVGGLATTGFYVKPTITFTA